MAGLLSSAVASVSGYHFQIRGHGKVEESEDNSICGVLIRD